MDVDHQVSELVVAEVLRKQGYTFDRIEISPDWQRVIFWRNSKHVDLKLKRSWWRPWRKYVVYVTEFHAAGGHEMLLDRRVSPKRLAQAFSY